MNKISALWALLQRGGEVGNAAAWTNRTLVVNLLVALLGVATAFGFKLDIDSDTLLALAGGIVAAVGVGNSIIHMVTDKRVGMPPGAGANGSSGGAAGAQSAPGDIRDPGGA